MSNSFAKQAMFAFAVSMGFSFSAQAFWTDFAAICAAAHSSSHFYNKYFKSGPRKSRCADGTDTAASDYLAIGTGLFAVQHFYRKLPAFPKRARTWELLHDDIIVLHGPNGELQNIQRQIGVRGINIQTGGTRSFVQDSLVLSQAAKPNKWHVSGGILVMKGSDSEMAELLSLSAAPLSLVAKIGREQRQLHTPAPAYQASKYATSAALGQQYEIHPQHFHPSAPSRDELN